MPTLSPRTQILIAIIGAASAIAVAAIAKWPWGEASSSTAGATPSVTGCENTDNHVTTGADSMVVNCPSAGGDQSFGMPAPAAPAPTPTTTAAGNAPVPSDAPP